MSEPSDLKATLHTYLRVAREVGWNRTALNLPDDSFDRGAHRAQLQAAADRFA